MRKLLIALTAITLLAVCLILLPTKTQAAETDGIYTYTVSYGKATITGFDISFSGDLEIPATLGGYPVTKIGDSAFRRCTELESVTIPEGVESIGANAFSYCYRLTSITIPSSVTSIGQSAFSYCSSLTSVTIPDSVTSIDESAFCECNNLWHVLYKGTETQWSKITICNIWGLNST